ncbi:MAG: DUF2007 domain-containing protein [Lacipirellulaceae bacterium]
MSDHSETTPETELVELCKAGDEFEARMILGLLEDHAIHGATTGEFTAGFRAEAPGVVRVYVAKDDLPVAANLVAEASSKGEPEESTSSEEEADSDGRFKLFPQGVLIIIIEVAVLAIIAWQFLWD